MLICWHVQTEGASSLLQCSELGEVLMAMVIHNVPACSDKVEPRLQHPLVVQRTRRHRQPCKNEGVNMQFVFGHFDITAC